MEQKMSQAMRLKRIDKPMVFSLYSYDGDYRSDVATEVVNAARLVGFCQVHATTNNNFSVDLQKDIERFKRDIRLLTLKDKEVVDFSVTCTDDIVDPSYRIDVHIHH